MTINIQRECCGCMAEVVLHGLNIIPALNGDNCITVAHIVKPFLLHSQFFYDFLEVIVDRTVGIMPTKLVCKNQIPLVFPCWKSQERCRT